MDEKRLQQIAFAELLNQLGVNTGVNTEKLLKKELDKMGDIIIKRFTYDSKSVSILKDGEFWLDGQVDTACNHHEICEQLNLYETVNKNLAAFIESKGFTVGDVDEYTEKEIWGFGVK